MISRALVQTADASVLPEMNEAAAELMRRGLAVERFQAEHLLRRQVKLAGEVLVVGEVPVVESALEQLGVEPPAETCYPECLRSFLHRRVWPSTIASLTGALRSGSVSECFVKPRGRIKVFTGRMVDGSDVGALQRHAGSMPVWCSELVSFRSEHRAFVIGGAVRALCQYAGEPDQPDADIIRACVETWTRHGDAAAGFAIDFGVLRDGQTALVEVNDGYSLGTYGCPPATVVDLLIARWEELVTRSGARR